MWWSELILTEPKARSLPRSQTASTTHAARRCESCSLDHSCRTVRDHAGPLNQLSLDRHQGPVPDAVVGQWQSSGIVNRTRGFDSLRQHQEAALAQSEETRLVRGVTLVRTQQAAPSTSCRRIVVFRLFGMEDTGVRFTPTAPP